MFPRLSEIRVSRGLTRHPGDQTAGDMCKSPGSVLQLHTGFCLPSRSLGGRWGEGNGTPLQYSCLENPMDGGAWWAAVHGVAKSQTRLSDFTFTFHFHALEKWHPTPVFLPGESQGQRSLVGCHPWGREESDTTE